MKITNVLISDIVIPDAFKNTAPNNIKMERIRQYVNVYNTVDEPVTISSSNVLTDGYIRYLIAKENNMQPIPCFISDKNFKSKRPHKYIIGKFDNDLEYVWKICNNFDINVGDKVLVANRNGSAIVSVVKIFNSNDRNKLRHKPVLKIIQKTSET